jgi:hypothetical protein
MPSRLPLHAEVGGLTTSQKKILSIMLNGDPQSGLLMHIIRFVMPSKSKPLKKLMYFFFEVCPKHDSQGKLRQEWILVWFVDTLHLVVEHTLTFGKQCDPFRLTGAKRIRPRQHIAICVGMTNR